MVNMEIPESAQDFLQGADQQEARMITKIALGFVILLLGIGAIAPAAQADGTISA
jgi:hypothetical protein